MLLKKKNIVVNIPDENKEKIEKYIKELGYNEYNEENIYRKLRRKKKYVII